MVGSGQDGNNVLTDDDDNNVLIEDDDNNGDGGSLIFGEDGDGFHRGVFLCGCTGLPLQHTRHSPLVSW